MLSNSGTETSRALKPNQKALDSAKHDPKLATQTEYSVIGCPGLKVVVAPSGQKSFHYKGKLQQKRWSKTIGYPPGMTFSDAINLASQIRNLLMQGVEPSTVLWNTKPSGITFADFVEEHYLFYAREHKRSVDNDVSKLNRHMLSAFGPKLLNDIGVQDIDVYLMSLRNARKSRAGQLLKPATRNRHLALLSAIFRKAMEYEMATRNPCAKVKQLIENNQRVRRLSADESARFWRECLGYKNPVIGQYLRFLLLTGARLQEGLSAVWSDIDLTNQVWRIPKTKAGLARYVPLNPDAIQLLQEVKQMPDNPHLFPGKLRGKSLNNPRKGFQHILKQAGITDFRIHDLRHSFASIAKKEGATQDELKDLLGHSSYQTTARYVHTDPIDLREASKKMGAAVQRFIKSNPPEGGPTDA